MDGIWRRWFGASILALVLAVVAAAPAGAAAPALPTNCGGTTSNVPDAAVVPVPTGPAVATSTINVSGAGTNLRDVDVLTNLTHTFAADIDMTVTSPAGTVVTLTTDNGAGNDNVFDGTRWDDRANPAGQVPYVTNQGLATDHPYVNLTPVPEMAPEEPLAAFNGENPNGTWTLTISDDLAGDGGTLNGWSLDLSTVVGALATAEAPATEGTDVAIPTGPAVVASTVTVTGPAPICPISTCFSPSPTPSSPTST